MISFGVKYFSLICLLIKLIVLLAFYFFEDIEGVEEIDFNLFKETNVFVLGNEGICKHTKNFEQVRDDYYFCKLLKFIDGLIGAEERL